MNPAWPPGYQPTHDEMISWLEQEGEVVAQQLSWDADGNEVWTTMPKTKARDQPEAAQKSDSGPSRKPSNVESDGDGEADLDVDGDEYQKWKNHLKDAPHLYDSSLNKAVLAAYEDVRGKYPEERIVICSAFLRVLDIIEVSMLKNYGVQVHRWDRTVSRTSRSHIENSINTGSPAQPLLIAIGAGGTGLNLNHASILIQTEYHWSRDREQKMYARLQQDNKRQVKIIPLLASDSKIEDEQLKLRQLQQPKPKVPPAPPKDADSASDELLIIPHIYHGGWDEEEEGGEDEEAREDDDDDDKPAFDYEESSCAPS